MSDIIYALHIAQVAHKGQQRKYNGAPYITHPIRVMVRYMLTPTAFAYGACAAVLHDVLEDCRHWSETRLIDKGVSKDVVELVRELTNPSKMFPQLNRAERKAMDREHIAGVSHTARCIKLIDRADNLGEMDIEKDPHFADLYAGESELLLAALRGTDASLEQELADRIAELHRRGITPKSQPHSLGGLPEEEI